MPQNKFKGVCDTCGLTITTDEALKAFDKVRGVYYYRNRCKPCQAAYQKQRYNTNVVGTEKHEQYKDKCRRNHLKQKYGLSAEEHQLLLTNGCEVCGSKLRLAVDHDHTTKGTYRGILCNDCNTALGMVKESVETLKGLITYLEKHK